MFRGYTDYLVELLFVPLYQDFVDKGDGLVSKKSAGAWLLGNGSLDFLELVSSWNIQTVFCRKPGDH